MRPVGGGFAASRLVRFATVGTTAAGVFFVLAWLLVRAGLPPFAGSAIAYLAVFVCAYAAQRGWTFASAHGHGHALPRYIVLQAGCAGFSGVVSHVAVVRYGLSPMAMSALTTVLVSAASYVLSLLWVFPVRDDA